MGSFNATCIISGLPIEAGDPVRFLALTESEYHRSNEHCCYVTGRFQPRTAPVRAKYNDYGSINKIQECLTTEVFFKSFEMDTIEKGVGDNQCHDVQVRKGMPREQWLEALWEGRVFVGQGAPLKPWDSTEKDLPVGLPTLTRIEKVLKDADLPVVTEYGAKGFVLGDVAYGFLRVRNSGHEDSLKALGDALLVIRAADYAAMITCGTGTYRNNAEILVAPMPGEGRDRAFVDGLNPEERRKPERGVTQAMVREDVWQILLGMELPDWGGKTYTVQFVKEEARKAVAEHRAFMQQLEEIKATDPQRALTEALRWELREHHRHGQDGNLFLDSLRGSEGVSGFYFKQAYQLGTGLARDDAELETFLDDLSEMIFVQWAYSSLHGQWHPTTNSGQEGNWNAHRKFLLACTKLRGKYEEDEIEDEGIEIPVKVIPEGIQALIHWRDKQVLDFSDDYEYVSKVISGLTKHYELATIPDEHKAAWTDFMALSEDDRWEAVEITLDVDSDDTEDEEDDDEEAN